MKKLLCFFFAVILTVSSFAVITSAANENEWEVYASVGTYKDEYKSEDEMPKVPGMIYTEHGVQMYTASSNELNAMNKNAWGGLQLKNKISIKDGFTMTAVADKYTEEKADKWIAFCLWSQPKPTPGDTEHGTGWFCLIRPNGDTITILSFINTPVDLKAQATVNGNIYNGDELVLDVKKEDGKLNIYVNDIPMKADGFDADFVNGECYVGIVGHQGNRDELAITVTEVNGEKPTGNESCAPFVPSNVVVPEPGPEVEPNEPCWSWSAADVKNNVPGTAMTSTENSDGSLHITFNGSNAPALQLSTGKYLYDAEEFPVFAIKFKNLDKICDSSLLWYNAGDVYAAKEGAVIPIQWSDSDYEEEDGWKILTVDLSGDTDWEGDIHGFRLDFASSASLSGKEADVMWIGIFRSEREAYNYAGFGALYNKLYGETEAGDVNMDGSIDNKDVVTLFRYVSSDEKAVDETLYDFNEDGEVDNKDVVALFRYVSAAK